MTNALIKIFGKRPPFIKDKNGCTICVSIHDHWHLYKRKVFKQKIKDAPNERELAKLIKNYKNWMENETKWYENFGLQIPNWNRENKYIKINFLKPKVKLLGQVRTQRLLYKKIPKETITKIRRKAHKYSIEKLVKEFKLDRSLIEHIIARKPLHLWRSNK